jgi:hypothetical protein
MRHQPSKIVLIASGIAISILLSTIAEGLMSMNTPGAYTVFKLFPPSMGPYDLRAVLLVHFGATGNLSSRCQRPPWEGFPSRQSGSMNRAASMWTGRSWIPSGDPKQSS